MNLIVAVSADWGIGWKNELLFRIPADLKRFKEITMGKTVVMGHSTFRSLPHMKPLSGRKNIVLSRGRVLSIPGALVVNSKEQVETGDDVFIIGGGEVYGLFLDDCTKAYVTKVDSYPKADRFFPNLDEKDGWHLEELSEKFCDNGLTYRYCVYIKTTRLFSTSRREPGCLQQSLQAAPLFSTGAREARP